MEGNRDQAKRALEAAQACLNTEPDKALILARKACALYWSPAAAKLVKTLETAAATNHYRRSPPTPKFDTSSTRPSPRPPAYTRAQLDLVNQVRRQGRTQYYRILGLKPGSDQSQVKSAFRKLALALHPDKNNAPGADEAFQRVHQAFQVLSNVDKRFLYDRQRADPPSNYSACAERYQVPGNVFTPNPAQPKPSAPSPANFQRPYSTPQKQDRPFKLYFISTWRLPCRIAFFQLISLVLHISLFLYLPSLFEPSTSWTANSDHPIQRVTHTPVGVSYFVNPFQFAGHQIYQDYLRANPELKQKPWSARSWKAWAIGMSDQRRRAMVEEFTHESRSLVGRTDADRLRLVVPSSLQTFERGLVASWTSKLQSECKSALIDRAAKIRALKGFWGLWPDHEAIKKLKAQPIPPCEELKKF